MSSESGGDSEWEELQKQDDFKLMTPTEQAKTAQIRKINKRVDELVEVLDVCIADLQEESRHLNKLKHAL